MIRIFLIVIFLAFNSLNALNIDSKIKDQSQALKSEGKQKLKATFKVKFLANQINKTTKKLNKFASDIDKVNIKIKKNRKKLLEVKNQLKLLEQKLNEVLDKKEKVQFGIINIIVENYSSSISINLASKHTLNEIIDSHVFNILSLDSRKQTQELDTLYKKLINNQIYKKNKIKKLQKFINKDLKDKKNLLKLEKKYSETELNLKKKHVNYKKELKNIIFKQQSLSRILGKLKILKKKDLDKAAEKREKIKRKWREKQASDKLITKSTKKKINSKKQFNYKKRLATKRFNSDIKMDVRSIGSSTTGIKTIKYRGQKTIAPLKSYSITKKFGKNYDSVYKIKLFNDYVELKTKKANAKVYSILKGKVVFSKKNSGLLENVVIVQHKNNLHTIYSHLDQIAPTIREGKWVKKGSVLGRVDDTLTFQATKNSRYINPKDLF